MKNVIGPKVLEPVSRWYEENVDDEPDGSDQPGGPNPTDDAAAAPSVEPVEPAETVEPAKPVEPVEPSELGAEGSTDPRADVDVEVTDEPIVDLRGGSPSSESLASARAAEAFFAGPDAGDLPAPEPAPMPEHDAPSGARELAESALAAGQAAASRAVDIPKTRLQRIKDIGLRVKDRIKEHNLAVVAAGIAFWGLLAIPAVLTAVLSIYGLVADENEVETQIEDNLGALPEEARSIITSQLESVAGASGGGLAVGVVVGIILALWTSSGAIAKVIATLNTIWGVHEDRKFLKLRGLALFITLGSIVFVIGAAFLLAVMPAVLTEVGLADVGRWLLNTGRFPALLLFMAAGLAVLYWVGPNRRSRYRPLTWGAVLATLLWVVVSGAFSIYTARFNSYNETYGTLGAIVILLMWLFITAFMVLIGAEIDAAREEADSEAAAAD